MRLNLKLLSIVWVLSAAIAGCSSTIDSDEDSSIVEPVTTPAESGSAVDAGVSEESDLGRNAALLKTRVVYFDFDSSTLKPGAYDVLEAHAANLTSKPDTMVRLEGHADERGTREYNMALGERRANAVFLFLRSQGVPAGQMEVISFGEEKPADFGHSEAAWAENRRAEIRY